MKLQPKIIFYEKSGCAGNKRQKELLRSHGIAFETADLLETEWDYTSLSSFFAGLEKEAIVNPFAPAVKQGEVDLSLLSRDDLITLMIESPILIKRPLIDIGGEKFCGFDTDALSQKLGVDLGAAPSTCTSGEKCE